MVDVIHLSGLEVFAHHGVFPEEREHGQLFVVDLDVEYDASIAARSDDVADTINYAELAEVVHDAVAHDPVDLLETLAMRVLTRIFSFPQATHARVTIHKPSAPMPVVLAGVSITVERSRAEVGA
jgi:dihydroneopterin aldolase